MQEELSIKISNEFASVTIKKVKTRNGERLEIDSSGHGLRICLDALQLESLTWQKPAFFSELLARPLEAK